MTGMGAGASYPAPLVAWTGTTLLLLLSTSSYIDRSVISLLVTQIRADLVISDLQIGLLQGFAFAFFYTSLGIPIARLSDRRDRRVIVCGGAAIWSITTMACGAANSFGALFLARMGVGIGEAALPPAAYSRVRDSFPAAQRARGLSVYSMGISLGSGLALVIGGAVIKLVERAGIDQLPVYGEVRSWQVVFALVGFPGLILAVLFALVPEPTRQHGNSAPAAVDEVSAPSFRKVIAYVSQYRRAYIPFATGFSSYALVTFGFSAWVPTSLVRSFSLKPADVGITYGALVLGIGPLALIAAGSLSDWMRARGIADAPYRVGLGIGVCMMPCVIAAPLMASESSALLMFALALVFTSAWPGVAAAALLQITPGDMGARISALYLFCNSVLGFGIGPLLVGLITDRVFHDDLAVRYGLAVIGLLFVPLGLISLAMGRRHYLAVLNFVGQGRPHA